LSENLDLSLDSQFFTNKLSTKFSVYQNTFTDLVDFDPIAFTNINRSKVQAQGVEVYVVLTATEQLNITAQVTYNKIDTFKANIVLRRRPEWKGSLQFNYKPVDALSLTSRIIINDSFYDSSIATGMLKMKGFVRVDLSAAWQVSKDLYTRINVNNIFNNEREESIGFNNMGRNLMASISKGF
jgi:outer membrane cobalamin receptor